MFRNLNSIIEKKKEGFVKINNKNDKLNRVFTRFLEKYFPEGSVFKYQLSCDAINNKIIIETPNKIIASELIMRIDNLSQLLKEEEILVRHIVIH